MSRVSSARFVGNQSKVKSNSRLRLRTKGATCGVLWCAFLGVAFLDSAQAVSEQTLASMEDKVVSEFCSEREWLRCFHEDPAKCESIVKRFARPCLDTVLKDREGSAVSEKAVVLVDEVIECFNTRFEETHAMGKDLTPECQNAPAHLQ